MYNVTYSTITNNTIFYNAPQIAIYTISNNNRINDNTVYGGEIGIEVSDRGEVHHRADYAYYLM
jgi:hypothetical protein